MGKVVALIAAAGRGTRMQAGKEEAQDKKQYLVLGRRPILGHTIAIFEESPLIDEIVLVVAPEDVDYCQKEIVDKYCFTKVKEIVVGGKQRQDSVYRGLLALNPATEIVLVHDGVRPFFPGALIPEVVEAVYQQGTAVVGVPVKDTIKIVGQANIVEKTPDRQRLWAIQTPQAFRYPLLLAAYRAAMTRGLKATDDAMLVEAFGHPVQLILGTYDNVKITTPDDLLVAEVLLQRRKPR